MKFSTILQHERLPIYEEDVLIDLGATDFMTYSYQLLDFLMSAFVSVCLADGNIHDRNHKVSKDSTIANAARLHPGEVGQTLISQRGK